MVHGPEEVQQGSQPNNLGVESGAGSCDEEKETRALPAPGWCPPDLTKTQCHHMQKLKVQEMREQRQEVERDRWFNQERPMTILAKKWKEEHIEKEEQGDCSDGS
jgi:hypothetical protein